MFAQDSLTLGDSDDDENNNSNDNPSKKKKTSLSTSKDGLIGPLKELETYSVDSLGSLESETNSPRDVHNLYKYTNNNNDDDSNSKTQKKTANNQNAENRLTKPELYLRNLQHSYDIQKYEQFNDDFNYEQKYGKGVGILETSPKKKKELINQAISTLLGGNDREYHTQSSRNEAKAWIDEGSVPVIKYD